MKEIPAIKSVMTPFPYSVGTDETVTRARQLMSEHGIRHLAVMNDGELVGVVGDLDIDAALAAAADTDIAEAMTVGEVGLRESFIVDMSHPLGAVLEEMAKHHHRSVLVVKGDRLAGIFTETDACHYFAKFLRDQFAKGGDDVA